MQLLPLIAQVINTTPCLALPRGVILYEVQFGRQPPAELKQHIEGIYRAYLSAKEEVSDEGAIEESLFVDEDFEQDEEQELVILFELTKRVAVHMKKQ